MKKYDVAKLLFLVSQALNGKKGKWGDAPKDEMRYYIELVDLILAGGDPIKGKATEKAVLKAVVDGCKIAVSRNF